MTATMQFALDLHTVHEREDKNYIFQLLIFYTHPSKILGCPEYQEE